jgi:hypothetical protein
MGLPEPLLQALRLGAPLAAEVEASGPERLAGVTIFPLRTDLDLQAEREHWKPGNVDRTFLVRWREYSRLYLEQRWDLFPSGMWELRKAKVTGEQALESLLQEWSVPITSLNYLWETEIPE